MTAQVYRRPEADGFATLVVDFTPLPLMEAVKRRMAASNRVTTSSRAPGQVRRGTVYYEAHSWKHCPDCGGICHGKTEPGRHAPVGSPEGMRNCVGKLIEVWP